MESARIILKPMLAFIVLLGMFKTTSAQDVQFFQRKVLNQHVHNESCASQKVHELRLQNDPVYRESFKRAEREVEEHLRNSSSNRVNQVYTVPVVVHVIHTGENIGEGANISDEQVQSAIFALNEDFRRVSGSNGAGTGVDVEIEFCLALRDPSGNTSNGIVRVDGSSVTPYATEGISIGQGSGASETAIKSLSHWPSSDYYNIWIVNEIEDNDGGAGIQGYAYFPNNSIVDGAVILYNAFGTTGTLKPYTNMNRVTTHELGHAFSLYHTFQGGSCTESDCVNQGDRVCDTPPTTLNSSCNSPACSGSQQVENYMDYTSQTCQNMFTQGQKDRMRASLETQRSSLLSSLGCVPVSSVDVSTNSIESPSGNLCSNTFEAVVSITNFGSQTINSMDINYYIDSQSTQTYNWTGSLGTAETINVTLPEISSTPGSHTLHVFTESPNGAADENQSNDLATTNFEIVDGENVEVNITLDNFGADNSWEISDGSGNVVATGGPYTDFNLGQENIEFACLTEGCYNFTMFDDYGDGMCCQYGFGSFELTLADGSVAVTGGQFDDQVTESFCVGSVSGQAPVSDFSSSSNTTCEGTSVNFSDESNFTPTSWNWTFEGGNPSTSTDENPDNILYENPGTYEVTLEVSNANGSDTETKTSFITVTEQPVLSAGVTHASCFDSNDGSIDLLVQNWTAGIIYDWNNGFNGQDPSGLSAGNYTVNIEDQAGCTAMASFTVNSPEQIELDLLQLVNVSCNGDNSGSIEVSAGGGVPGYSYEWNDSNNQQSNVATNLSAGSYHVIVTDANNCELSEMFQINEPSAIMPEKIFSQPDSCAQGIGSAELVVSGGVPGYEIVWDDPLSTTGPILTNALSGQYMALITDQNNCSKTASVFIDEISCGGASVGTTDFDASATTICEGSTVDFTDNSDFNGNTWNWTFEGGIPENSTEQNPSGILYSNPGTYFVSLVVSTADGSDAEVKNAFITVTNGPTLNGVITDASCFNSQDGSINLQLSNATSGITYEWSNGFIGQDPSGLAAGDYTINLVDGAGCHASATYTVGSPDDIFISNDFNQPDSCDLGVGMAEISIFGGTAPYTVNWDDPLSQSGMIISNVLSGEYNASIVDANGCQKTAAIWIEDINCDGTVGIEEDIWNSLNIFPNPLKDDVLNIDLGSIERNELQLDLFDMQGKLIQSERPNLNAQIIQLNLNELSNGLYMLRFSSSKGSISKQIVIERK